MSESIESIDENYEDASQSYESKIETEIREKSVKSMSENCFFESSQSNNYLLPNDQEYCKKYPEMNPEQAILNFDNFESNEIFHVIRRIEEVNEHPEMKIEEIFEVNSSDEASPNTPREKLSNQSQDTVKSRIKKEKKEESAEKNELEHEFDLMKSELTSERNIKFMFSLREAGQIQNFQRHSILSKAGQLSKSIPISAPDDLEVIIRDEISPISELNLVGRMKKSVSQRSNAYQKKNFIPCSSSKSQKSHSLRKLRPYMMDARTRRQAKDYGTLCKTNRLLNPRSVSENVFEVKFISTDFEKSSEQSLSIPSCHHEMKTLSTTSSRISLRDKYRTEPKQSGGEKREQKEKRSKIEMRETATKKDHVNYSIKQHIEMKQNFSSISVFERIKGDERDLPGVYSRFVRRTKCSTDSEDISKIKKKSKKKCIKTDDSFEAQILKNEIEEYILGELIADKPIDDRLLDLINKKPFKFNSDIFPKTKIKKKKIENLRHSKESAIKNSYEDLRIRKVSSMKKFSKTSKDKISKIKNKTKKSHGKKYLDTPINTRNELMFQKLENEILDEESRIFTNDLIKENVNMSPTTTITMMMLAADKKIGERSEILDPLREKISLDV